MPDEARGAAATSGVPPDPQGPEQDARAAERAALLERVSGEVSWLAAEIGRPALQVRVRSALQKVPRHRFVRDADRDRAYQNRPLPIGCGQTISQPFIVAVMTELLDLAPGDRVLEVGTGCGYQTAVLAELVRQVYSIEVIPELAEAARERLTALGYANVQLRSGDGALGWREHAPFNAVLVAAAAPEVPAALLDQLAPGGRLVAPIGSAAGQRLLLAAKDASGALREREILPVAFVPLHSPTLRVRAP